MIKPSQPWKPKPRRRSEVCARIDLTALRGASLVVFVLLCMFPGRNRTGHNRFPAELPGSVTASPYPGALRDDAVQIGIKRDGKIFVFGSSNHTSIERADPSELSGTLRSRLLPEVERRVYIKADARAKYADVETALDAIRYAGISNITIMVEQRRNLSQ